MSEQQIRVMRELDVQNVLNERIDYLAEQIANSSKENQLLSKVNDAIYEIARQEAIWIASLIKYKVPTADAYETKKQETVGAEPKHGKWIYLDKNRKFLKRHIVKCSLCNNSLDLYAVNGGRGDANYCPNCGARMESEEEE